MLKYIVLVLSCIIVAGAGCTGFEFNGVKYSDSDKALEAQRNFNQSVLAKISPVDKSLGRQGLVILPTHNLLELSGVYRGTIKGSEMSMLDKDRDFAFKSLDLSYNYMAEAVKKRGIFDNVEVRTSDNPGSIQLGDYDAKIYMSIDLQKWFVRTKKQAEPASVNIDPSIKDPYERTMGWLKSIEMSLAR